MDSKKVKISKTVFDKSSFKNTIDSKFTFFKEPEPIIDPDTVEELFRLYSKLYLLIPVEGERDSHQYLVEKSSELYQIDRQLESIQPLLDEVAQLRQQILDGNRRIAELEIQLATGNETSYEDVEKVALLQADLAAANANIVALETANTVANSAAEAAQEAAAAQAEAQATADEQAAEAAEAASIQSDVKELTTIFKDGNQVLGRAYNYMKHDNTINLFQWHRGPSWARAIAVNYRNKFYWLFGKNASDKGDWRSRRGGDSTYFIPSTARESKEMTLDFFVEELKQAGYKADAIVEAANKTGSMNNKVVFRLITYNDPEAETEVGYRLR
mgnify:CR=1 FL=1